MEFVGLVVTVIGAAIALAAQRRADMQLINRRFDDTQRHIDKRFDDVNKHFDNVNKHFDHTNRRIDDTNRRIDRPIFLFGLRHLIEVDSHSHVLSSR